MNTTFNTPGIEKEVFTAVELHQRNVSDLLGDAPNWLINTGSYLLYGVLILFLVGASLIRYPDIVRGSVIIEDLANVEWIKVNSNGQIDALFVYNDSLVNRGDTIGIIQNPARLADVNKFCTILSNVERYYLTNNSDLLRSFAFDLSMGEMKDAYEDFTRAVRNCLIYDDNNSYLQRKEFVLRELAILKREPAKNELSILKVERELFELSVLHRVEIEKNRQQLEVAYENIVNSLRTWDSKYLIRSHSDGRIVLGDVKSLMRMMNKGDTIGTVIANNKEEFVARAYLDQEQIAGIETGNTVIIRLVKYPEQIFGSLIGKVSSITFVPYNKLYIIDITFPDRLHTTLKKEIKYELGLKGDADIITSSRSVLSRVFNPIYALWSK